MRVAVIGAGIVGVTTAYELAADGHQVTVFERRGSVAAETSFANAGVVAPGYVTPWAAPGMPLKVLRHLAQRHAPVRLAWPPPPGLAGWLWRWWRACAAPSYAANRAAMHRLARYSHQRLRTLAHELRLDYERGDGLLVLLRTPQDVALARTSLKLLAELGVNFHLVDAARARQIETELNPDTALQAAIHLPGDEVGNCRQFAHQLRHEAERLGTRFVFHSQVLAVEPGREPLVRFRGVPGMGGEESRLLDDSGDAPAQAPQAERFDAVVLCAALGAVDLLAPLGLKLPLAAVHGYSVTLPVRMRESYPQTGPRAGVMDEKYKVAISRLGQRVRVAGSAELGGRLARHDKAALATLYKVLDDWFPGCYVPKQAQTWKGTRPMLPDGPPVLGASGAGGIWLNLGHGSSGWALACGSARVLADRVGARSPAIDTAGLTVERLRA
jgi:D-amino-acid dehydrogenase